MPRKVALSLVAAVVLLLGNEASAQPLGGEYSPLSLEAMIRQADRIVIGEVLTPPIEVMEERVLDGVRSPFLVRKVTLSNVESLKGPKTRQLVVDHYASIALPVTTGQRLLWFLGKKTSVGFIPILGKLSGDFEVVTSSEHPSLRFALNRVQNRGLWDNSPTGSLWTAALPRSAVQKALTELKVKEKFHETILQFGDDRCQPRPIPLDLIRAVSRAQLAESNTAMARPR